MKLFSRLASVCALAAMMASTAHANLLPSLVGVTNNGNGTYTYAYDVQLQNDAYITASGASRGLLTVFDFVGLRTDAGNAPLVTSGNAADWDLSVQNTGIAIFTQAPPDSPAIKNVTFKYTGAKLTGPLPAASVLQFKLTSDYNLAAGPFTWFSFQSTDSNTGNGQYNSTPLEGPNTGTPEPGTMAMLLSSGLGGSLMFIRRRRA